MKRPLCLCFSYNQLSCGSAQTRTKSKSQKRIWAFLKTIPG